MTGETDFIVSELLSELKAENSRKGKQIQGLHKVIAVTTAIALCAILMVVAGFLWYLNQYDFSATNTETVTAEGVYAIVDSEGNVIGSDFTAEEIQGLLEGVLSNSGESDPNENSCPEEEEWQI